MGAPCCSQARKVCLGGQGEAAGNSSIGQEVSISGAKFNDRKSVAGEYKKRAISIGYSSKGDDAEKFDKAFENNDLKAFVSLLSSQQAIESFEERMHPWAEDPKTVGALACTQLAILASVAEKDNSDVKDDIREAGAIPPLVDFLRSDSQDRVQASVVALSFLTAENSDNAIAAYEAGGMPLLNKQLASNVSGLRAAAATTLRNIAMEDMQYRKELVGMGGLKGLVGQLAPAPDPALNHADMQLESVLNLQDMIEQEDGTIIAEYAKIAIQAGAIDKLKKNIAETDDDEVRQTAEEVLASLQSLK